MIKKKGRLNESYSLYPAYIRSPKSLLNALEAGTELFQGVGSFHNKNTADELTVIGLAYTVGCRLEIGRLSRRRRTDGRSIATNYDVSVDQTTTRMYTAGAA